MNVLTYLRSVAKHILTVLFCGLFTTIGLSSPFLPDSIKLIQPDSTLSQPDHRPPITLVKVYPSEYDILVDLYNTTNGPNWGNRTGWLTNNDPCSGWFGIGCENGRVTSVVLTDLGLNGPIPASLAGLTDLKVLRLGGGRELVRGDIPSSLSTLTNLENLYLGGPQLTGSFPTWVTGLTKLKILQIIASKLTGGIPSGLGNLTQLQMLVILGDLTGSIPPTLGQLTSLTSLEISSTKISGQLPSELGNLINLEYLSIAGSANSGGIGITGNIPVSIGNLTKLKDLRLFANQLSGSIPTSLTNLVNLELLNLSNNALTGPIPEGIGNLTRLWNLALDRNQLSGPIPDGIGSLTTLGVLTLQDNKLSGSIPSSMGNLSRLGSLSLYNNQLSGSIPASLGRLNAFDILLGENQLTGTIPDSFSALTRLISLSIQNNQLSGPIPSVISSLTGLGSISLNNNRFTGSLPGSFTALANLTLLDLNTNQLTGSLDVLGRMPKLALIWLDNNRFTGPIPASLASLTALSQLRLQNNQLSGCIPDALRSLCSRAVDISNNPGLPNGGNWSAFCTSNTGSCSACAPVYTATPTFSNSAICVRGQTTASVNITSLGQTIGFQWLKDGIPVLSTPTIAGVNTATLTIADAQLYDVGIYQLSFTGTCGSATSTAATLLVTPSGHLDFAPLAALFQATNGTGWTNRTGWLSSCNPCSGWFGITCTNGRVTGLNLAGNGLNGCIPLTMSALCGQTVSLSNNPGLFNNGDWAAFCSSGAGTGSLSLISQPTALLTTCARGMVTLQVQATGSPRSSYQWYRNGTPLTNSTPFSGVTSATLIIRDIQTAHAGNYHVVVTGTCTSLTSAVSIVTVNPSTHPDYNSLVDFYYATNGQGWTSRTGWLSGCSPCGDWFGVNCNQANRVSAITLSDNQLSGQLPVSLSGLTELQYLNLTSNLLTGAIPESLGNLRQLYGLYLGFNQLTGSIPNGLSSLTALTDIGLYNNQLTGNIPASFSQLSRLSSLNLSSNRLAGNIPQSLSLLQGLYGLQVGNNQLTGPIPDWISRFINLDYLDLGSNQFTGTIPSNISSLINLRFLNLGYNQLAGPLPTGLSNLTRLEYFSAQSNQLTGPLPSNIGSLTALKSLLLGENQFSGSIPGRWANLTQLYTLFLTGNNLTGCIPSSLSSLCGKGVYISNNPGLPNGGDWAAFCTSGTGSYTGSINSLKAGYWHESTTWTCGMVPQAGDRVIVQHPVTVAPQQLNQAAQVRYEGTGKLIYEANGRLRLGQ